MPIGVYWMGVHIYATWRIRLNGACAAAMRPCVKLLWSLVIRCNNLIQENILQTSNDVFQLQDYFHCYCRRMHWNDSVMPSLARLCRAAENSKYKNSINCFCGCGGLLVPVFFWHWFCSLISFLHAMSFVSAAFRAWFLHFVIDISSSFDKEGRLSTSCAFKLTPSLILYHVGAVSVQCS